jgi:hypothetical protein
MEVSTIREIKGHDELSGFMEHYFQVNPRAMIPLDHILTFVDGLSGMTVYREGQFQVQLFLVAPLVEIHDHRHPNVDSYEVALTGMEFRHSGEIILPAWWALDPRSTGQCIRVKTQDLHGATAGPDGGSFLSVQHWLNGVRPTSVGDDWQGQTMGEKHDSEIATTKYEGKK